MASHGIQLSSFPQDVQDTVYDLLTTAILRAIKNGTYVAPVYTQDEIEQIKAAELENEG